MQKWDRGVHISSTIAQLLGDSRFESLVQDETDVLCTLAFINFEDNIIEFDSSRIEKAIGMVESVRMSTLPFTLEHNLNNLFFTTYQQISCS